MVLEANSSAHLAAALVDSPVPVDADPERVVREMHELRGLLAHEEARRGLINDELMALQDQFEQVLVDEEMLRERRGGVEPPLNPSISKGVALLDKNTYHSMLPEEQVEVSILGLKLAYAVTNKISS